MLLKDIGRKNWRHIYDQFSTQIFLQLELITIEKRDLLGGKKFV